MEILNVQSFNRLVVNDKDQIWSHLAIRIIFILIL